MNKFFFGRVIKVKGKILTVITKVNYSNVYKKNVLILKKKKVFDLFNQSLYGDYIAYIKCRPIKKTVFYILNKVIEKIKLV